VAVEAAGVTLPGLFHLRDAPLPQRPGGEFAGRVVALGDEVSGFAVGQSVAGVAMSGVLAEYAIALPALLTAVPAGIEPAEAMTVARSGLVALAALRTAGLVAGESVLVTAAAGGVGHLAIQLARALGARRVVGTVSDASKVDFVRAQGADEVVLSNDPSWDVEVDVVIETVGGEVLTRALNALAPFGRMVTLSAAPASLESHSLLSTMRTVHGLSLGLIARLKPELITEYRAELWEHVAAGRLTPAIAARLPLDEAAKGYQLLIDRANLGKVCLVP
jgi:NADPH:quinone reductase-like Zn-dependent oxidoreductase